jgi:hypothetical protein
MRHLGAGIEQQVAMTFAVGYLSYYTANAPAQVSGGMPVCSQVCFGHANDVADNLEHRQYRSET